MLTGCSSEEDKEQYLQPEGLDPLRVTLIVPEETKMDETVSAENETFPGESEAGSLVPEAEATGGEEESSMTVRRGAEVYNHPSEEGSEIGTVRRGERVSAIGPVETGNWYMIEYNGRVAYVEADVLGMQEAAPAAGATIPRESAASPSPAPSRTPGTAVSPGQTSPSHGQSTTPTPGRPAQESAATASPGPTSGPTAPPSPSPGQPTATPPPAETEAPKPTVMPAPTKTPEPGQSTSDPTETPPPGPTQEPEQPPTPTGAPSVSDNDPGTAYNAAQ